MKTVLRFRNLIVLLCWLPAASEADAQSRLPVTIELQPLSNVSRTCGPIRLQLKFTWGGPAVFHGDLWLEARDSERELLGTFHVPDLYLTEGEQYQEIMLPGFRVFSRDDVILLRPAMVDADSGRRYVLDTLQLLVPSAGKRELVIAACVPESTIGRRQENDVVDALRLENLAPPELLGQQLLGKSVDWPAEEAPQEPLRYCACDILLLPGDGLAVLDEAQLEAITAWLRAGGNVCLLLSDVSLNSAQMAFLNALCPPVNDGPAFLADSSGRLVYGIGEPPPAPLLKQVGLGRAAVVFGRELMHPRAEHWTNTAAFLWRVRNRHRPHLEAHGTWDHSLSVEWAQRELEHSGGGLATIAGAVEAQTVDMQPRPAEGIAMLVMQLVPKGLQLVPLSLIGLLLGGYLFAIGPGDYIVLGWLRLRKWTWITFPLLTVLFTMVSMAVSNTYMSTADTRRAAIIRDMVEGGVVARENRFELLFPSTSRNIPTELGRGLFMPTRHQDFGPLTYSYQPGMDTSAQRQRAEPAVYSGRMPVQCTVTQSIGQWTPQLNRFLTIPLVQPENLPAFDWDEVPQFHTSGGIERLRARIREAFGSSASAMLFHQMEVQHLLGSDTMQPTYRYPQDVRVYPNGMTVADPSGNTYYGFPNGLSVEDRPGFLSIVYQYAPAGGDRFEDLLLLDSTDPRQWLLVVSRPDGEDLLIYRRLYIVHE